MSNTQISPSNTTAQIALNCQLQQIASKAARLSYLDPSNKQGRRQIARDINTMVAMLDEQ